MFRDKLFKRILFLVCAGAVIMAPLSSAFARPHDMQKSRSHHNTQVVKTVHYENVYVGDNRYHYREGHFYRPGFLGLFEFVLRVPPVGAVIRVLPAGHRMFVVGGLEYYYYDNVYYRACPTGYIVVNAPVAPVAPVAYDTVTINVVNSNGSYTPVTLVRRNGGYIGPQGEFYPVNPTVEQLRALYAK